MLTTCPICDDEHDASACPVALDEDVWAGRPPEDGEASSRALAAAGTLRPLLAVQAASEEEIAVLETVHTDEDQRRRLSRSRRIVRAIRHLRLGRQDELHAEIEQAEIAMPNDARTHMVDGFARMLAGDLGGARERFESVAHRGEEDERLDGLLLAGRCLISAGQCGDAADLLERVVQEADGWHRAEARYHLARCVVARMSDEAAR